MLLNSQNYTLSTQENHKKLAWRSYFDIAQLSYQQLFLKVRNKKIPKKPKKTQPTKKNPKT